MTAEQPNYQLMPLFGSVFGDKSSERAGLLTGWFQSNTIPVGYYYKIFSMLFV